MKIIGLNLDIIWKEKFKNFELIEQQLYSHEANLFILPEMFSTGFCMNPAEIADYKDETLNWMKYFAQNKNAAVCGTAPVEEEGEFYNRMYFVKPEGVFFYYDKRHLFSFSGEDKVYKNGNKRVVAEFLGIRFLLQVCYDLRFPVFSRNTGDYDVALYVANWPEERVFAWENLLQARAIENQAYVFGLNRIGVDGNNLNYLESSHCFFADGTEISQKNGSIVAADIDMEKLKNFRQKYSFLQDGDEFIIENIRN